MAIKGRKKANVDKNFCVACGVCVKACPIGAIKIHRGLYAEVDKDRCVGCSKCYNLCPASVIDMKMEEQ